MKLVLFFSILTISLNSSLNAKDLLVHATAKIIGGNILNAQKQALKNVIFEAVKKSIENIMDLKKIKTNYGVIRNQIYKFSENFITSYEVIEEKKIINQNLYKISILANVNIEEILKKLKLLRILNEKKERKRVLLVYYGNATESLSRDSEIVKETLDSVHKSFDENGFLTFNSKTMNDIYMSIEDEKIGGSVDSFIALALIYNADILVLMQMNARKIERLNLAINKILYNIHFSIFDPLTGLQIAETKVNSFETYAKILNKSDLESILKTAGKHAGIENVRQAVNHIIIYYQKLGFFLKEYSVIFSNYSPQQEKLIIDYFENDFAFRNQSELKNTIGHLELEFFSKKRKGILRRKIISDLEKHEIEVATKTLAGNRIIFINPNSIEQVKDSDNFSKNSINE